MERKNLVIAGGGSTYTLGIIMSLIEEKETLPLKTLTLYDTDGARQERIGQATAVILREKYPELESFKYTTDKKEAFEDIDIAFLQIRTGGLAMREKDEQIPLKHGVLGQETCGPGGMAYGMRSIPDMIELVKDIRTYAKDAWILNYTNPAAIVAEALKRVFPEDDRLLNICDMPIAIMQSYADMLGKDVWNLVPGYFGLNHFGWFTKIEDTQGNDYTQTIKDKIISEGFVPTDSEIADDASWKATFATARQILMDFPDYLPNTYLQYYLYPEDLAEKESRDNTRARQVMNGRQKRVHETCDRIIADQSMARASLTHDIHGVYMVKAAASLVYHLNHIFTVMVKNEGVIANIPFDAMVEVPAMLGAHGPKPFAVGEIPTFYKGLIENQYAFETLVVDACFERSYNKLLQALTLNRTVTDVNKAKAILEDLIKANQGYWPELK
ncbi:6-phospho-alpha-glucosidase [Salinicoccus albus]|uniref:6-phospho-alpha-glucosidase n=1 Tax=Salinicoccus albus TaxID=418756 RepID=UPI00036FEEAF|nr:6-phospho-alpha-glucosidase [Salinicoccus albus]